MTQTQDLFKQFLFERFTAAAKNWAKIFLNAAERGDLKNLDRALKVLEAPATSQAPVNRGINVNVQDTYGDTALMAAAYNNHTEIVKRLLSVPNIDVNARNVYGHTAFAWAVINNNVEIVKCLLAVPGIDVHIKNDNKHPITRAKLGGRIEITRLIEEHIAKHAQPDLSCLPDLSGILQALDESGFCDALAPAGHS